MPVERFPPSAGTAGSWSESVRSLRLSSNKAGAIQYLLSNTNELANTSAADEEVHLDAIKPSE